jgi:hypothetical protein
VASVRVLLRPSSKGSSSTLSIVRQGKSFAENLVRGGRQLTPHSAKSYISGVQHPTRAGRPEQLLGFDSQLLAVQK